MDEVWKREEVESPCVKICVIHRASQLCIGCYRTGAEIAAWGAMDAKARRDLMKQLPARAGQLTQRRGGRAARLAD
ncbi:MAG: DUF1289 domain-containing protein [Cypionkella sp.]|nr:DUF1289 domain-containing protein [Cypionkella sp.]